MKHTVILDAYTAGSITCVLAERWVADLRYPDPIRYFDLLSATTKDGVAIVTGLEELRGRAIEKLVSG